MYNNSDRQVPIVINSLYAGPGFTTEGNMSDVQDDNTLQTRQVFDYDDINSGGFPYSRDPNEFDRLLTPTDLNNHLYYSPKPNNSFTRLNQLYRNRPEVPILYKGVNTSFNGDPKQSDPNSNKGFFLKIFSYYMKKAFEIGLECYYSLINIIKDGIKLALRFLVAFFCVYYGAFLCCKIFNIKFKLFYEEPRKISPPIVPKHELSKDPPKPEITFQPVYFKDILGIEEAKEDVMEVVKFIKQPYLYKKVGAKIPKGILLVGAPGTGKTMLAKAVATETGVPFIYTSGPEFVEIYVGQGAQRIRSLFEKARNLAPCIIFIDEIDAVGSKRASGSFSGQNREHDQTLNQLLVEMDGFNVSTGITILAATNRMNTLDKALLRPGRFDRVVHIPLPSIKGREQILNHYLKGVRYDRENVNVRELAKITPGYSGADLKNLVNEAALITVKQDRLLVTLPDLYEARDKIIMGNKRNLLMPELERKMTAYHEAGHALVAHYLYPHTDPIHKATIITRGTALGFVEQLPNDEYDKSSYKMVEMKSRLAVCMAGRLAEKLVFGFENITSGASSDIVVATDLAYRMVTQYGMSNKLASLNFHNLNSMNNKLSGQLNSKIENEIMDLIKSAERLAESILRTHRSQLELLASELLKYETLSGEQISTLLKTNKPLNLPEKQFNEYNHRHKPNDKNKMHLDSKYTTNHNNNNNNKEKDKNEENENENTNTNKNNSDSNSLSNSSLSSKPKENDTDTSSKDTDDKHDKHNTNHLKDKDKESKDSKDTTNHSNTYSNTASNTSDNRNSNVNVDKKTDSSKDLENKSDTNDSKNSTKDNHNKDKKENNKSNNRDNKDNDKSDGNDEPNTPGSS